MSRVLRVRPEAEAELSCVADWYESERPGLSVRFGTAIDEAFARILEFPLAWPVFRDGYPFRKHVVRQFPYVIFFEVSDDSIEIVAVAHARREPGYWIARASAR